VALLELVVCQTLAVLLVASVDLVGLVAWVETQVVVELLVEVLVEALVLVEAWAVAVEIVLMVMLALSFTLDFAPHWLFVIYLL
jgi:hypothetical protein